MNTYNPNNPKTILGTAAKLLIFISIKSVILFFFANSCKKIAADIPIGTAIHNATNKQ